MNLIFMRVMKTKISLQDLDNIFRKMHLPVSKWNPKQKNYNSLDQQLNDLAINKQQVVVQSVHALMMSQQKLIEEDWSTPPYIQVSHLQLKDSQLWKQKMISRDLAHIKSQLSKMKSLAKFNQKRKGSSVHNNRGFLYKKWKMWSQILGQEPTIFKTLRIE